LSFFENAIENLIFRISKKERLGGVERPGEITPCNSPLGKGERRNVLISH
jgi:hypothetical protein